MSIQYLRGERLPYPFLIFLFFVACAATAPLPSPEAKAQKEWSVAVMTFEDHSVGIAPAKTQDLGQMLADRISQGLVGQTNLHLIDRDALQKVLEELGLGSSDMINSESRLKLGKLLGSNYFIMGGFTALGEGVRIDGRIVAVETGQTEGVSVNGKFSDWTALEESISKQLVDRLITKVSPAKEGYE